MKRAEKENMAKEVHILASREWGQPQVLRRNVRRCGGQRRRGRATLCGRQVKGMMRAHPVNY